MAWVVTFWSFFMPLIGFVIFTCLTILPILSIWVFTIETFLGILYMSGFVPSVATALFFQIIQHRMMPTKVVMATGLFSMLAATIWWAVLGGDAPTRFVDLRSYMYWALMAASFGAAVIMALSSLRSRNRHQRF